MARRYYQGKFKPKHPEKYVGDPNNIIFRSSWEVRLSSFLDNNPNCIQWGSEEFCVNYVNPIDGKVHRYFPDYIAKFRTKDGKIDVYVIEVKPYDQSVPPKITRNKRQKTLIEQQTTYLINQAKWAAMKAYCDKVGWKFKVITEKELAI